MFGGLTKAEDKPKKTAKSDGARQKRVATLEEHVAFLKLLGHTGLVIPGEREYIEARELWIESYRAYSPLEQQQLERYRKDLLECQAMKQSSSPAN